MRKVKESKNKLSLSPKERTVVFTGAGFSKSVGVPLQGELLRKVVPPKILKIHNVLMGHRFNDPVDIEEFLSCLDFDEMLEGYRESLSNLDNEPKMSTDYYIPGFTSLIYESIAKMKRSPKFWQMLVSLAEVANTFITVNWDTLIEIQLRALKEKICYSGNKLDSKRVLKLHGSIDWYKIDQKYAELKKSPFEKLFSGYVRYKPFSEEPNFFAVSEKIAKIFNEVPPAIIAPTHLKSLPSRAFREIWSSAWIALQSAEHVVIIGYSLPPSDILVRLLLQKTLLFNLKNESKKFKVTIINPDRRELVKPRYIELLGDKINFIRCPFLDVQLEVN